jgi:hypothetical protein
MTALLGPSESWRSKKKKLTLLGRIADGLLVDVSEWRFSLCCDRTGARSHTWGRTTSKYQFCNVLLATPVPLCLKCTRHRGRVSDVRWTYVLRCHWTSGQASVISRLRPSRPYRSPYEEGSCVLDARRSEQLGVCGWVGAKCSVVGGFFNCDHWASDYPGSYTHLLSIVTLYNLSRSNHPLQELSVCRVCSIPNGCDLDDIVQQRCRRSLLRYYRYFSFKLSLSYAP